MSKTRWACAGTFDPVTNGHLDVFTRASRHCDELVVAVVDVPSHKAKGMFSTEQRMQLVEKACQEAGLTNVVVMSFTGLLVRFAKEHGISCFVRGLRTVTDFEYEFGIAQLNHMLDANIETFYVLTEPRWSFCSSSAVRELHSLGGDASPLVPPCVKAKLASLDK